MTDPADPSSGEVGSVAEEAAKLIGAISGWAKDQGGDLGAATSGAARHATDLLGGLDDHVATGAPECTWCPLCRTIHAVRELNPEVKEHLAVAAASLMQAVAGVLATPVPDGRRPRAGVQHIDLDEEPWPEEDG